AAPDTPSRCRRAGRPRRRRGGAPRGGRRRGRRASRAARRGGGRGCGAGASRRRRSGGSWEGRRTEGEGHEGYDARKSGGGVGKDRPSPTLPAHAVAPRPDALLRGQDAGVVGRIGAEGVEPVALLEEG